MTASILAQDPAPKPAGDSPLGIFGNPLFMMALLGLFFVVVILPQGRRQKKEQAAMLANLKPGAKVVTSAGIIGTVVQVKDGEDELTVRSADAKLKVLKSSVVRLLGSEETAEAK